MAIGICTSTKSGHTNTLIDTCKTWRSWKCVDISYINPADRPAVERADYFAVCEYCKDFKKQ